MLCCDDCTDLLLDLAYDLLDADQEAAVRAHLDACAACRDAHQQALGQKSLLARAAHVCPEVPPFLAPTDAEEPAAAPEAPDPAVLPVPAAPPTPRRRRPAWGWVAAAAAVLLVAVPAGYYQHGLATRQAELASLRRQVSDLDEQSGRAAATFQKLRTKYAALDAEKQLRLEVTGPSVYQPEAENRYRVALTDLDGNAVSGTVYARLVGAADKDIYRGEEQPIKGDRVVTLPAGLPLKADARARLEIQARAGETAELLSETIAARPAEPLTQLTLNKRQYYTGEIVFFRSVTLDRYTLRPPEKAVMLQQSLCDARGNAVLAFAAATGPGGIASGEFALTKDLADGDYTLQVADEAGKPLASRPLRVSRDMPANLHFHRQQYRPGDKVLASYQSRRQAAGNSLGNQTVNVKVLADDGKPLEGLRQPIQVTTNPQGQADIEFQLPRRDAGKLARLEIQLQEGKDVTNTLVREVPLATAPPRVEFFPEGGDLLADAANRVYFRATTSQGEPADLEGRVVDSAGREVARVRTEPHDAVRGLGSFTLTPLTGEKYRLLVTAPAGAKAGAIDLPAAPAPGVALSVENPVDAEGEPIRVVLQSAGAKKLLLTATCRERTVAQQTLSASTGTLRTSLAPAAGARGTLRLTVYEIHPAGVTPLAERLIFREPAQKLALSAATDKYAYPAGDQVKMTVRTADETGAPAAAWLAGLVVDERVVPDDPSAAQSMPAFFYLLSEVGRPRDLDNADVLLAPGDQARRALDLFLGTHGWRHFVPAAGPGEPVAWFHRENGGEVRQRRAAALTEARAELDREADRVSGLRERGGQLRDQARLAFLDLSEYEQRPRQLAGVGLGVLVAALLLAGAGLLLWGLALLARGGAARPHLLVAMGLLGCCLVAFVAFGGRRAQDGQTDSLAWLQSRPAPDLAVPRPTPTAPAPAAGPTGTVRRMLAEAKIAEQTKEQPTGEAAQADKDRKLRDEPSQAVTSAGRSTNPYRSNSFTTQTYEFNELGEDLKARFKEVAQVQETAANLLRLQNGVVPTSSTGSGKGGQAGGGAMPGGAEKSAGGFGPPVPPVVPVGPVQPPSPVPVPPTEMKHDTKGPPGGQVMPPPQNLPQLDNAARQREYAHKNTRKVNDAQDTVFWHPALVTQDGAVTVNFDLSSSPTSYRVLLYGHTADGRLGGFQGRLTTRPYPAGKR